MAGWQYIPNTTPSCYRTKLERWSLGKQTWQDAITEVMGAVVVVLETTGGFLTVHPQNSFRKDRKTPTDPKASTRTHWVPFYLIDWRIPSSSRLPEGVPTTYYGPFPHNATTKASRPCFFFSYHHLQPAHASRGGHRRSTTSAARATTTRQRQAQQSQVQPTIVLQKLFVLGRWQ